MICNYPKASVILQLFVLTSVCNLLKLVKSIKLNNSLAALFIASILKSYGIKLDDSNKKDLSACEYDNDTFYLMHRIEREHLV